ncbi:tubulin-like doman-containing protein [Corynebacterium pacaense]|uniref:tubulin-like doman-containing protein n=1 Tax=Corynebacterium pacaense TaxID=1816684 RepID=UPI0009BAA2AC|nr:tubulin-like doman-containing protein [Corynebacterium pacaense]
MRKFLVVGCGGSGAKTQAYMIDQLKATLRSIDPTITSLPKAWQFVTIDVPIVPEKGPSGLGNVQDNGGTYIGIGSKAQYRTHDASLSTVLGDKKALGEIATWAPRRPTSIPVPISDGAGQYRAIGRMLTIPALTQIRNGLEQALDTLHKTESVTELNELTYRITGRHSDKQNEAPIIFVVSSMAGGAGASMFLDVCRVLSTLKNGKPDHTAVFMLTPEVFEKLAASDVLGTWPNALAMFGEAIATQTGASAESDRALFRAMGLDEVSSASTFARLFPIGARMGSQGTVFGDGYPDTVYRGLGRALAALMASEEASDSFASFFLANTGSPDSDRSFLGWANPDELPWDGMPWASMGYAQLSMGRDRFAEYSAQRLARTGFDRLLRGHLDPANNATGEEQLQSRLNDRIVAIIAELSLQAEFSQGRPNTEQLTQWLSGVFREQGVGPVENSARWLRSQLRIEDGIPARDFSALIRNRLSDPGTSRELHGQLDAAAYATVYDFADTLTDRLIAVTERELAHNGVPFVEAMLARLKDIYTQRVIQPMWTLVSQNQGRNPAAPPHGFEQRMQPLSGNGAVSQADVLTGSIISLYRPQLFDYFIVRVAGYLEKVLDDFVANVLTRLLRQINAAHAALDAADRKRDVSPTLADVATADPVAWPRDSDERIDSRFYGSHNEILITEVDSFPRDFATHLLNTVRAADDGIFDDREASRVAARAIVLGQWESQGAKKAPDNTLAPPRGARSEGGNRAGWVSKHLSTPPAGGETREARAAQFQVRISPEDILKRSREWIERPNYPFSDFISADLRTYLTRENAGNDVNYNARLQRLRSAFDQALAQARPLAAVDSTMVQAVHGSPEIYRFTFSEIPFKSMEAADSLSAVIQAKDNLDNTTLETFTKSLGTEHRIQHIDVFGSYPNYSPIVFSSLLPHISEQWAARRGRSEGFWSMRRARPLPAALPMSNAERRAMVAGWIIGTITGRIYVANDAAFIFDDSTRQWVPFPNPLLTPPSQMIAAIDWMPAVIESVLLAYAGSQTGSIDGSVGSSLLPYRLLRSLYDSGRDAPTTGIKVRPAVARLTEFLRNGDHPVRMAEGTGPVGESVDERYDIVRSSLEGALANAAQFIPSAGSPLPGSPAENKPWASVSSREYASGMPFYRDLAPDVYAMVPDLLGKLDEARDLARRPVTPEFNPATTPGQDATFNANPDVPTFKAGGLI